MPGKESDTSLSKIEKVATALGHPTRTYTGSEIKRLNKMIQGLEGILSQAEPRSTDQLGLDAYNVIADLPSNTPFSLLVNYSFQEPKWDSNDAWGAFINGLSPQEKVKITRAFSGFWRQIIHELQIPFSDIVRKSMTIGTAVEFLIKKGDDLIIERVGPVGTRLVKIALLGDEPNDQPKPKLDYTNPTEEDRRLFDYAKKFDLINKAAISQRFSAEELSALDTYFKGLALERPDKLIEKFSNTIHRLR